MYIYIYIFKKYTQNRLHSRLSHRINRFSVIDLY